MNDFETGTLARHLKGILKGRKRHCQPALENNEAWIVSQTLGLQIQAIFVHIT
jgi:hypothetical protein